MTPAKLAMNGMLKPDCGVAWKSAKDTDSSELMSKIRPLADWTRTESGYTCLVEWSLFSASGNLLMCSRFWCAFENHVASSLQWMSKFSNKSALVRGQKPAGRRCRGNNGTHSVVGGAYESSKGRVANHSFVKVWQPRWAICGGRSSIGGSRTLSAKDVRTCLTFTFSGQ